MKEILKFLLYALSVVALLFCGLLAWAGYGLEINKGSGSVPYASAWAAGIVGFGLICTFAFGYMAKSVAAQSTKRSKLLFILSCIVGALFAVFILLISRNISGTWLVFLPVSVLALVLPVIASFIVWRTS